MSDEEIKVFIDGVVRYFERVTGEPAEVDPPEGCARSWCTGPLEARHAVAMRRSAARRVRSLYSRRPVAV